MARSSAALAPKGKQRGGKATRVPAEEAVAVRSSMVVRPPPKEKEPTGPHSKSTAAIQKYTADRAKLISLGRTLPQENQELRAKIESLEADNKRLTAELADANTNNSKLRKELAHVNSTFDENVKCMEAVLKRSVVISHTDGMPQWLKEKLVPEPGTTLQF